MAAEAASTFVPLPWATPWGAQFGARIGTAGSAVAGGEAAAADAAAIPDPLWPRSFLLPSSLCPIQTRSTGSFMVLRSNPNPLYSPVVANQPCIYLKNVCTYAQATIGPGELRIGRLILRRSSLIAERADLDC